MEPKPLGEVTLDVPSTESALSCVSRGDGKVYQRKGSARFWIRYSFGGHRFREPGGKTKEELEGSSVLAYVRLGASASRDPKPSGSP
jgi:hypothetical protein